MRRFSPAEPRGSPRKPAEIVLDLSRLVSRFRHNAPTGVDRVEMAYARELLRLVPERLSFGAVHPAGRFYGRLSTRAAVAFLERTEAEWGKGARDRPGGWARRWQYLRLLWALRLHRIPAPRGPRVVLQSSPHHLDDEALVASIMRRERAALVCVLHDIIPVEFPEYARPGGDTLHRKRIATIARLAAGVVSNSHATLASYSPFLNEAGREIRRVVAHLGLDGARHAPGGARPATERPYFVCVGTIEPRKNHLLLLHVWRRLAETHGPHAIPKLVVIGRRGWENEQVVDLLERCPVLAHCVEELGRIPDDVMHARLAQARALLLPSFAEGYGMPIPEALAAGVPVLCSDLPALREAGGEVPEYLDPLDGPGWAAAVMEFTELGSPRRLAQMERIKHWVPPTWSAHMTTVLQLVEVIADERL